jgi:hypothetical protein
MVVEIEREKLNLTVSKTCAVHFNGLLGKEKGKKRERKI